MSLGSSAVLNVTLWSLATPGVAASTSNGGTVSQSVVALSKVVKILPKHLSFLIGPTSVSVMSAKSSVVCWTSH